MIWAYLVSAWLGAVIGVGIMCLFQINKHDEIMKDEKEEK